MTVESIIGIASGLISIGGFIGYLYNRYRKQSLKELMGKLTDRKLTTKEHQRILKTMNRKLPGHPIKSEYIRSFVLNNRGPETVFKDICEKNRIVPDNDICNKFMGYDMNDFRVEYLSKYPLEGSVEVETQNPKQSLSPKSKQTVYMSELLRERYPETCNNLLAILEKHHVNYSFLKGTNDIWCRDYMPVRLESGKLIQFRYEPSYLMKDSKYVDTRSDVHKVCEMNGIKAEDSKINLDGGNVLICDGRAIISDRVFSENPGVDKESLIKELSSLLECEIIIIPAINDDFTGHADGMVRFVDRNTILGNDRAKEYKYWRNGISDVLAAYHLNYIDVPFFEDKSDHEHKDSAIGVYVNFLELDDLIIAPVFKCDVDDEAIAIIEKAFPNKPVERIDYRDVAKEGGLLNCTTWVA